MLDPTIPANDLPLLPHWYDFGQRDFLQLAIKANYALAQLDWLSSLLPNYELLISPLLAKECIASNEIENINTTMIHFLQQEAISPDRLTWPEKEVQHYRHALMQGIERMNTEWWISTNLLIYLQSLIEPSKPWIRKIPWTVIANHLTNEVIYTPPQWEHVIRNLLGNLEQWINMQDDQIDPLIKMAVIHYQFESIHPFYDGNGRVGRILMMLYLLLTNKISKPILFLSSYITKHKQRYYASFTRSSTDPYRSCIEFLLQWVIEQSTQTKNTIIQINDMMTKYTQTFQSLQYKESYFLAKTLFAYPFVSISALAQHLSLSRQTIHEYVKTLLSHNLIKTTKIGRNTLIYIPEFIDILS